MLNKGEESTSLAKLASTGHRGQMSAEPIVGIKFRRNRQRRGGMVCRTMNAT